MKDIEKLPLALFVLTGIAIAYLSLSSLEQLPKVGFSFSDKIAHCIAYGTLSFLGAWTFKNKNISKWSLLTPLILYGVLIEILQFTLTTNRHFEISDIIANIIGCILGVFLFETIIN